MLALYRDAVAKMRSIPSYDPRSWIFQANTHWVPPGEPIGDIFDINQTSDSNEQSRIAALRDLALGTDDQTRIWATCTHGHAQFLPWHRMYLLFFERIIEAVIERPFALPYWSYISPEDRPLPIEFREDIAGSAANNALWFAERNSRINHQINPATIDARDASWQTAWSQETLLGSSSEIGFSADLENTPHGAIHIAVGTPLGMGRVPFAARDPIFWLHHANLDRLWESWRNRDGGPATTPSDPTENTWLDQRYSFAGPVGERVETTSREVLNLKDLGYTYDKLEPPPTMIVAASSEPSPFGAALAQRVLAESAASEPALAISGAESTVHLTPTAAPFTLDAAAKDPNRRYLLVLSGITAAHNPDTRFDVFINLPANASSADEDRYYAGSFDLFGNLPEPFGAHEQHAPQVEIIRAFNITAVIRGGAVDPAKATDLEVTVRARGRDPSAIVSVEKVVIIAR